MGPRTKVKRPGRVGSAASGVDSGRRSKARAGAKARSARKDEVLGTCAHGKRKSAGRPPIRAIINRLEKEYPDSKIALEFESPVELLVATILAAQCTDERVNQVTKVLFSKYRTPSDYARASLEDLMEIVRPTGFFRNKSKSIKAACGKITEEYGGGVPQTMAELVTLPGVARKTANIVLGDAFGVSEGIAVDTHMLRLSRRLGLTREKDPVKVERDLCAVVPRTKWKHFPHLIADHGRAVCKARTPLCGVCLLAKLCPSRL